MWQLYRFQDWGSLLVGSSRTNLTLLIFLEIKIRKIAAIFFKWRKIEENNLTQASLQADTVGLSKLKWCVKYYQLLISTQSSIQHNLEEDTCFQTEHIFSTTLNITKESKTWYREVLLNGYSSFSVRAMKSDSKSEVIRKSLMIAPTPFIGISFHLLVN